MQNSKTYQNLMNSFAGESQARQRYEMYAKVAKKEGWNNISNIFLETASNEFYHGQEFYKLLVEMSGDEKDVMMGITASYPIARTTTYENLLSAANGESDEVSMYEEFASIAKEEGFNNVAAKFELIAKVEGHHSKRYQEIADLLKAEQLVSRNEEVLWKCDVCGHIHYGKRAPKLCPICAHSFGHFEHFELNL